MTTLLALLLGSGFTIPVKVDGPGYLRFVRDGRIVYANADTLVVRDGLLASSRGPALTPSVRLNPNAKFEIELDGTVRAEGAPVGKIVLAVFDKPLRPDNGFLISESRARLVDPGAADAGVIRTRTAQTDAPKAPTAAPQPKVGGTYRVNELSEIEGDQVVLGNIASVPTEIRETVLFPAPPVGIDMFVSAARLKSALAKAGVRAELDVPAKCVVRRKGQKVAAQQFVEAATAGVVQKLGVVLSLSCEDSLSDIVVPSGEVELKSEAVQIGQNRISATVAIYVSGKRLNSRTLNFRPDSATPRIEANTVVKVSMKSAGLTVEINGKTRSGGFLGQTVTVVTETGSLLEGKVIGADRVEVKI